jgi:hypothetical protein
MVQKVSEANKLQINKEQFIGKPFKNLLSQIGPKIIYVYGNPDNQSTGAVGGTYIKLFFVDKNEVKKRLSKHEEPTGITVRFELEPKNNRKPIPLGGINMTSRELEKAYGDMIVLGVFVNGEN